jgi:hypothetical protein
VNGEGRKSRSSSPPRTERLPRSLRQRAAVDHQLAAGHVGGVVGSELEHDGHDLLDRSRTRSPVASSAARGLRGGAERLKRKPPHRLDDWESFVRAMFLYSQRPRGPGDRSEWRSAVGPRPPPRGAPHAAHCSELRGKRLGHIGEVNPRPPPARPPASPTHRAQPLEPFGDLRNMSSRSGLAKGCGVGGALRILRVKTYDAETVSRSTATGLRYLAVVQR